MNVAAVKRWPALFRKERPVKIDCRCGSRIVDSTDNLPNKAYLLPDQDFDAACLGETPSQAQLRQWDDVSDRLAMVWQCERCGRICFDGPSGELVWFKPESTPTPPDLLRSVYGERWSGPLRGHWLTGSDRLGHGDLFWTEGAGEVHFEEFEDSAALKHRYDEVFADLHRRGLVRDALLRIDGATVHTWASADRPR
jgi:hypothetical protein